MTRHTTMLVGPTGGGKSVVINTLAQSQTRYVIMCKSVVINTLAQSQTRCVIMCKSVVINTLAQSQTRYVMCNRQVEKINTFQLFI
jgi:septin family protein